MMGRSLWLLSSLVVAVLFSTPARAADALMSPLYTDYNTFIKLQDVLELAAGTGDDADVRISIYRSDGTLKSVRLVDVAEKTQTDLNVNEFIGLNNQYGTIRVDYNDTSASLRGRMTYYKDSVNDDSYQFVYARELRQASNGSTYATSNSIDPQGQSYLVANWAQIHNLTEDSHDFTHNIYDQTGALVRSTTITLGGFQRLDLPAGHDIGEGVFLNEFQPDDDGIDYMASVVRYGSNQERGTAPRNYTFAIPFDARSGDETENFVPISNQSGDCFRQTSWVELVNVSDTTTEATVEFRDEDGILFETTTATIAAKAQLHLNANDLLDGRASTLGSARITATVVDSLISQGLVYYQDCNGKDLQTAYGIQSQTAVEGSLTGSYNRFLGQSNQLIAFGTTGSLRTADLTLTTFGSSDDIFDDQYSISNFEVLDLNLNDEETFNTTANTFGAVTFTPSIESSVIAHNIRSRMLDDGETLDFAFPTPLQ